MMPTTSPHVRCPVTALKSFMFEGIGVEQGERLLMPADQIPVAIDAGLVTREAPARDHVRHRT